MRISIFADANIKNIIVMSRPATITENKHTLEFTYNGREERVKSRFYKTDNSNPVLGTVITDLEQRYYLGNIYERHIKEDGEERTILYLGGDAYSAPAAFVMDEQYGPHMAYICRDHLGSITLVISDQYTKEYSYDAWGNLRNPWTHELYIPNSTQNSLYLGRGYTGHEHHGYFGLINMNARMYEPILGRFISPDPFVQMPDNSQNFNRYTYCLNNPLRYTDESGEWFLVDDLFAIIIGGAINLTSNIIQGNISGDFGECFAKGFAAFSAGGIAGWGGLHPELGGWAWGGAIAGATNAWLGGATTAEGILFGGAMGIVSSGAGALGGHLGNQLGSVIINGTKIASPAFASTITEALGGVTGGYTGGLAVGLLATGDFSEAHDMALDGALSGGVIGAATGFAGGIKYARDNKISPWTGEKTAITRLSPSRDLQLNQEDYSIQVGSTPNQKHHAFRHTDQLNLDRNLVENLVKQDAQANIHQIPMNKPYNGVININGYKIQYTAFKRVDKNIINIGRIHAIE